MANTVTYDKQKVTELRMKLVDDCLSVLNEDKETEEWPEFKKALILKMSARVLPQLNAGRDDDEPLIPIPLLGGKSNGDTNESDQSAPKAKKED